MKNPPKLSGSLPVLGHVLKFMRDPVQMIEKGYRENGEIFSISLPGKQAYMLIGPAHNKFVFDQTDKLLSIEEAYPFFERMFSSNFFYFGGFEAYKKQKNIIIPCFKNTIMPNYLDAMIEETNDFMESLGDAGSFDLLENFGPLVMRIAARSFLGNDFKEKLGNEIFEDFRHFSEGMDPVTPGWVPLPKFKRSQNAKKKLKTKIYKLVEERRNSNLNKNDFLQTISTATYSNGEPVADDIIIDLILLLVWAGHETTAGHISWALIDLLQNKDYLNEVLQEQSKIFTNAENFTMEQIRQSKKLELAIKETERLHPIAYILMRSAKTDFEYSGYNFKKGSTLFISPAVSHQLPEVFENPKKYMPSRFENKNQINHSLIGFGGGMHRCTGVNFAFLEMKAVLSILLRNYNFELLTKNPKLLKAQKPNGRNLLL